MNFLTKILAIIMFPISILIILEQTNIYSIPFPIDKLLIGAILMISLEVLSFIMLKLTGGELRLINILTYIIFIIPAIAFLVSYLIGLNLHSAVPLILGVMMLAESIYGLH